ncbi:MAG: sugar transferase [Hyphomicrobiaceae bacterium]|nr:sugar transferase [Hyphomicrobiaceae bacterium]
MRHFAQLCADLGLVVAATLVAAIVRADLIVSSAHLLGLLPYVGYSVLAGLLVFSGLGTHRTIWRISGRRDYGRVAVAAAGVVIGAVAAGFLTNRLEGVPRALPLMQFGAIVAFMVGARLLAGLLWTRRRSRANPSKPRASTILVVGLNSVSKLFLQSVAALPEADIEVAGLLGRSARQVGRRMHGVRVLGVVEDVRRALRDLAIEGITIDRIVVAVPMSKLSEEARAVLLDICRDDGVPVVTLADNLGLGPRDEASARDEAEFGGMLQFSAPELALVEGRGYWPVKRAMDIALAVLCLAIAAPVLVLLMLLVLIDVGRPVVFCQRRPGYFGRSFKLYKLRTMSDAYDGDRRLPEEERSSAVGRLLRRLRLDEVPQLYNVLVGDMSFVGPRPLLPVDQDPLYRVRLLVRPGLTGWAQVKGGRIVSAIDKAVMDAWYVQNASLWLDLKVMARTVPMVLFGDRVNREAIERAWRDLAPTGICSSWTRPRKAYLDDQGEEALAGQARAV